MKESFIDKIIYFLTINSINIFYLAICPILKIKIKINDKKNIPEYDVFVMACTHESSFDITLSTLVTNRKLRYIAKEELFNQNKIFLWWLKKVHTISIKRGRASVSSIIEAIDVINNNEVLVVFPEGTRKKIKDFSLIEEGTAMIALKSKINPMIVPIAIIYDKTKTVFGIPSSIIINCGEPIKTINFKDKTSLTHELALKLEMLYTKNKQP